MEIVTRNYTAIDAWKLEPRNVCLNTCEWERRGGWGTRAARHPCSACLLRYLPYQQARAWTPPVA